VLPDPDGKIRPMRDVAIALSGVLVGALLNHVAGWRAGLRRDKHRARGIARLLHRDVFATFKCAADLRGRSGRFDDDPGVSSLRSRPELTSGQGSGYKPEPA